jgi:hypothetical protein
MNPLLVQQFFIFELLTTMCVAKDDDVVFDKNHYSVPRQFKFAEAVAKAKWTSSKFWMNG